MFPLTTVLMQTEFDAQVSGRSTHSSMSTHSWNTHTGPAGILKLNWQEHLVKFPWKRSQIHLVKSEYSANKRRKFNLVLYQWLMSELKPPQNAAADRLRSFPGRLTTSYQRWDDVAPTERGFSTAGSFLCCFRGSNGFQLHPSNTLTLKLGLPAADCCC